MGNELIEVKNLELEMGILYIFVISSIVSLCCYIVHGPTNMARW